MGDVPGKAGRGRAMSEVSERMGRAGEDRTGQVIPERSAGSGAAGCMEEKREYSTDIICIQSGVETFEMIVKIKV